MPEYLVELYSAADPDPAALIRLGDRSNVRYVRSILIPGDETVLHLVEADSAEQVGEAFAQVGLEADRIVEAVGLQASAPATATERTGCALTMDTDKGVDVVPGPA